MATTIPNPDICDQVNTILRIAKKRAFIDATFLAVNAGGFFSQNLEDFTAVEVPDNNVQAGGEEDISKEPDDILSEPSREQLLSVLRVLFERLNIKKYAVAYTQSLVEKYAIWHAFSFLSSSHRPVSPGKNRPPHPTRYDVPLEGAHFLARAPELKFIPQPTTISTRGRN